MTDKKQDAGKNAGVGKAGEVDGTSPPGVMGDGTEEQNIGQPGNPDARITQDEVEKAFGKNGDKQPN